jgi:hypothetical protein
MPSATVNTLVPGGAVVPTLVTKLTRGKFAQLGTLIAANTAVAFTIPEPTRDNQGVLIIQTSGTAGTTATLEGSIDGGNTFFVIPASTTPTLAITGQLTGDTAATFAAAYQVSGMGSGCLFKFGFAGAGVPTAIVFALVG